MIISAQVVDNFITRTAGHSYALDFEHWNFVESTGLESAPWCNPHDLHGRQCAYELKWVLSVGYLLCMAICIPFGWLNLDENMWFQWLSFGGLLLFTFEFWGQFIVNFGGYDHSYTHNATTPNASFTAEPFGLAPGDRFGPVEQFGYAEAHHNVSKNGFVRTPFFVPSLEGQSQVCTRGSTEPCPLLLLSPPPPLPSNHLTTHTHTNITRPPLLHARCLPAILRCRRALRPHTPWPCRVVHSHHHHPHLPTPTLVAS